MATLPAFTQEHANCGTCELKDHCHAGHAVFGLPPTKPFNGIMIIGEWPSTSDIRACVPFSSRPGALLRQLLLSAGIDMDECYLTNALTGGMPRDTLLKDVPNAILSCLPRLEAEIAAVKPRVILGFGTATLRALVGYEVVKTKRVRFECDGGCNEDRKIGPVYQCAKCKHIVPVVEHIWPEGEDNNANCIDCGVEALAVDGGDASSNWCIPPRECPECDASMMKLKPKMVKCPACGGKKMRDEERSIFMCDYNLGDVAGMVIPGAQFDWDKFGVKYIIPTFSPGFLLVPAKSEGSGDKKVMAGQFAAFAVQRHMQKALTLSKEDRDWSFEYEWTVGDGEEAADRLQQFVDDALATTEHELSFDIETEAYGCAHYCNVCEKKSFEDQREFIEGEVVEEFCPNCEEATPHTLETCEMDARELEQVTKIKVIGFGSRVMRRACVVDTREMRPDSPLAAKLKWLLTEEPELGKVAHHGTYDVPVIERMWGYRVVGYTTDTLIKHHAVHADETHSLAHLAARYTFAPMWKPPKSKRGAAKHESFEELVEYNARDVMVTSEASYALDIEVRAEGMEALHASDMALQQQALDMQANGLPLDYDAACEVGATALEKEDTALAEMRGILGDPEFNPNAPAQLQKALYVTLGNAVTDWTSGGKSKNKQPSTAKEVLVKLKDSPFKRALLAYREANSVTKAFFNITTNVDGTRTATPGRSLNIWEDGRVHVEWKPFGTVTGRFSSSPNMQNVPKWLRSMFKVAPGRKIVAADYDQLELRTLAMLCGDPLLVEKCMTADDKRKLEPDFDPHSFVASNVFKQYTRLALKDPAHNPDPKIKCKCETCHRKNLRDICKRVIYGLNYGAGEATVLEAIYNGGYYGPPISIADIRVVKEVLFKLFPGILTWRERMVREAEDTRELCDVIGGRRREFPLGEVPATEIANYPIQASSAGIVNERCILLYNESKRIDPSSMYIAQVHDAVYYEVAEDKAAEFADAMTRLLTCEKSHEGSAPMLFSASASIADNMRDV